MLCKNSPKTYVLIVQNQMSITYYNPPVLNENKITHKQNHTDRQIDMYTNKHKHTDINTHTSLT